MRPETKRRIIQSIEGERYYQQCQDTSGREDEMFYRLNELMEQGVLTGDEVNECLRDFRESIDTGNHYPIIESPVQLNGRWDVC